MDIGVVLLIEIHERIDYLPGLLGSGRVVQIDKRVSVDLPLEYGEVLPYEFYVQQSRA